jgi:hypothetical protein
MAPKNKKQNERIATIENDIDSIFSLLNSVIERLTSLTNTVKTGSDTYLLSLQVIVARLDDLERRISAFEPKEEGNEKDGATTRRNN